jgi:asparaginyl-tRNA synthetase
VERQEVKVGSKVFQIREAARHVGESVELKGWVRHLRSSGSLYFIEVRDGTGELQVVIAKGEVSEDVFSVCSDIRLETSLAVRGVLKEEPRAPGGYEILASDVEIIHSGVDEYPLTKKSHGTDFLMENRHLWIRSSRQLAILRVRSELIRLLRTYYHEHNFVLIDTPILTGSIGESAGTLFQTEYFDMGKAFLAQTGQLYLEAAASGFGKVFCLGPTFRAEKSKTRRHLTEFWMLEAEMAFCDSNANMDHQEDMIAWVIQHIVQVCERELMFLKRDLEPLRSVKPPFTRMAYGEAVELLQKKGFSINWGEDIGGDEETALSESFDKPLFLFNYPRGIKAFYMSSNPEDSRTVLNDDLIAPEGYGEVIGGSQRNDDYDSLLTRIEEEGLDPEAYRWYLDLRRYGSVPHAGFGLGVERLLSWVCRLHHVREAIPFPRLINRLYP